MARVKIADWNELEPEKPYGALVRNVDLVVVRWPGVEEVSVLYGRCLHRGALLADGEVRGEDLICSVHEWDYRYKTGVSAYSNSEVLHKFRHWIRDGGVWVDEDEVYQWELSHPQPYDRDAYLGRYADPHGTTEEAFNVWIQEMATNGLENAGHHGRVDAMGVPRQLLPQWSQIQILTAQLHRVPRLDDEPVATGLVIGPGARRPLELETPLLVSDMSFGALSFEAKVALARGADAAGTAICSGEGGMLPEEQEANRRYMYELASGRFGFDMGKLERVQAFHFKCGQGAKTGTGGHLPGHKVTGRIAEVRGLEPGTAAISPSRFPDWDTLDHYRRFADEVREATGGIPIGFKLSAQHIERDIGAALEAGADYVILDGRGGGTGAAPRIFRDNISVPTIPALARARRFLDEQRRRDVTLIITGGLRVPSDFVKALALGADGIALANSAMQAIGCIGMRACHTNSCPVGIATQKEHLRQRLEIAVSARRLQRFLESATELMCVLARACGHERLDELSTDDLTTWDRDMACLAGIPYAGMSAP